MNVLDATADFMRGFQAATGLAPQEAAEQWAWFSRQLTDSDRQAVEECGYDNGLREGQAFRQLYPEGGAS